MGFTKIDSTDLVNIGVIGLPDTPGLSTGAMQAKLEETGRSVIIPKHNALIDELEAPTAADYLGATPITGRTSSPTVQAVMQKLSDDLGVVEAGMASAIAHDHTHSNLPLLETYTQTETDLADAVSKKHAHSNLSLLETYTQTETDLADAVSKKHAHSNKSLLDSYTQSESDLADAVSKKHSHSNKALLDTYTQTEANLADAVSKKHAHSNKTVIDALSDNGGTLEYNGSPVGGGSVNDAFKSVLAAGATLTASGEDTFEIAAGSNVVISTDLTTTPKKIIITSTGGGSGSANWGSIGGTLSNQSDLQNALNAKADTTSLKDLAFIDKDGSSSTKYLRGDGTWQAFPSIPAVDQIYNAASTNAQSGTAVAGALAALSIPDELSDLTGDVNISSPSNDQVLKYDGTSSKWINGAAPASGHTMIANTPESTLISTIKGATSSDDKVVSSYGIQKWSNCDAIVLMTTVAQGTDTVGTWVDNWDASGASRAGWLWSADLYRIIEDGSGNPVLDIELIPVFDNGQSENVNLYAYRIDDDVQNGGVNGGAIAFKFNGAIKSASGLKLGVKLVHQRTNVGNFTVLT